MRSPFRRNYRYLPPTVLAVLGLAAALPGHGAAPPAASTPASSSSAREAETRDKLAAVRARIAKIAAEQRATAAKRQSINAQLAEQATRLDQAAAAVRESDAAIAARAQALSGLQAQRDKLESGLGEQRSALAGLLRAAYTLDRGPNLSLLLGDGDIARVDRALAYSRYFQQARIARIHALLDDVARLDKLATSIHAETAGLQQQRDQRASQVQDLEQARASQQALLAKADAELARQKDTLAALEHDAAALDKLLKQLENVFSDIPAQLGKRTPFAKLRGKLPWPVAGKRKRGPAAADRGVVIAAAPGSKVKAVAYGRVAWADFMRGYGMLVIIDHGGGWMSLYGGNESLLVSAGDWVEPGQPIATVGRNSERGGAWFGLRHDGKPVDPDGWLAARH